MLIGRRRPFAIGFTNVIYNPQTVRHRITLLDETVIRIDEQQYWPYATVDPKPNELLYLGCF